MATTTPSTGSDVHNKTWVQYMDDQYISLVSQYYLSPFNSLILCLPSTLDLQRNCTATLGLYQVTSKQGSIGNDTFFYDIEAPIDSLDGIAQNFRPALPLTFQSSPALDICDYWHVLQMIPYFQETALFARDNCSFALSMTHTPVLNMSSFNFTQDCQATISYWDTYLDPSAFWYGDSWTRDLLDLLQTSLTSQFADTTYSTLYYFAIDAGTRKNLSAPITQAANICQPEYCRTLGFAGNADIAGIGAIIAYGAIAFLSTVICLVTIFTKHGKPNTRFKFAMSKVSVSFLDTLLYFNFMVFIAGMVYFIWAGTVYEKVLCVLVGCQINSASIVLTTVYSYPQEGKTFRKWVQAIGVYTSEIFIARALRDLEYLYWYPLEDNFCYEGNILPLTALKASCWLQVTTFFIAASYFMCIWLKSMIQLLLPKVWHWLPSSTLFADFEKSVFTWLLYSIIAIQLPSMWANFYFIIIIRREASQFFGPNYGDNAMGYGQIIASGFCVQVIVQWIYYILFFESKTPEIYDNNNISLHSLNLSTTHLSAAPTSTRPEPSEPPSPTNDANDDAGETASVQVILPRTPTIEMEEGKRSNPTTPTPSSQSIISLAAATTELGQTSSRDTLTGTILRRPTSPSP